jgi:hypothetical protein
LAAGFASIAGATAGGLELADEPTACGAASAGAADALEAAFGVEGGCPASAAAANVLAAGGDSGADVVCSTCGVTPSLPGTAMLPVGAAVAGIVDAVPPKAGAVGCDAAEADCVAVAAAPLAGEVAGWDAAELADGSTGGVTVTTVSLDDGVAAPDAADAADGSTGGVAAATAAGAAASPISAAGAAPVAGASAVPSPAGCAAGADPVGAG